MAYSSGLTCLSMLTGGISSLFPSGDAVVWGMPLVISSPRIGNYRAKILDM